MGASSRERPDLPKMISEHFCDDAPTWRSGLQAEIHRGNHERLLAPWRAHLPPGRACGRHGESHSERPLLRRPPTYSRGKTSLYRAGQSDVGEDHAVLARVSGRRTGQDGVMSLSSRLGAPSSPGRLCRAPFGGPEAQRRLGCWQWPPHAVRYTRVHGWNCVTWRPVRAPAFAPSRSRKLSW